MMVQHRKSKIFKVKNTIIDVREIFSRQIR